MDENEERVNQLYERFEREQREFENHWLWKQLGTTPQEFFALIERSVKQSGIPDAEWQIKLARAREAVVTRVQESKGEYQKINLQSYRGLRV